MRSVVFMSSKNLKGNAVMFICKFKGNIEPHLPYVNRTVRNVACGSHYGSVLMPYIE